MDWFLYDRDFRRERVNYYFLKNHIVILYSACFYKKETI